MSICVEENYIRLHIEETKQRPWITYRGNTLEITDHIKILEDSVIKIHYYSWVVGHGKDRELELPSSWS